MASNCIRDIQSVAIVPPSSARQVTFLRSPTTPKPFIAIQDRLGNVVSINVIKFPPGASSALTPHLPSDTNVTGAAGGSLRAVACQGSREQVQLVQVHRLMWNGLPKGRLQHRGEWPA